MQIGLSKKSLTLGDRNLAFICQDFLIIQRQVVEIKPVLSVAPRSSLLANRKRGVRMRWEQKVGDLP